MTAAGVLSHSSAQKTSSSRASSQKETVFRQPQSGDEPLSLTTAGEVRPDEHGLGAALSSGVIGGVSLRQLLRPGRVQGLAMGGSSDMALGIGAVSESLQPV